MRQQMRSFDTYTHINDLKKAGFNEEQAAVIIKSLVDSRDNDISHLATKDQLESAIAKLETTLIKWMVGTMIAFSGIILAGIKLL
jgi:capsule polysaccharide export protein KpsE/RkpR